jgi:hypothetical protein
VLIDNFKMVDKGTFLETETFELLTDHGLPVRNPGQNIADLKAQIAANEKGVQELRKMVAPVRPRRGAGLHEPRAGQCRGKRAPGDRALHDCEASTRPINGQ